MIKKTTLGIIFLLCLISVNAYNSSYSDLYLDTDGWCSKFEMTFKVYNLTEYENNKNDKDFNFTKINADVIVYDGPFSSIPNPLFTGKTNNQGEFKTTFPQEGKYLIEIQPQGEYNFYETIFEVLECKWANSDKSPIQNETDDIILEEKLYNHTFNYLNSDVIVEIKNTKINSSDQLIVTDELEIINPLNNTIKTIRVNSLGYDFTDLKISLKIAKKENATLKGYFYDESNNWKQITLKPQGANTVIENAQFGIYSITQTINEDEIPIIKKEEVQIDINDEEKFEEIPIISKQNNKNLDNIKSIAIIVGVLALILLPLLIFISKRHNNYHNQISHEHDEKPLLTTYNQTYDKAKEYIIKHKNSYGKDQLYRALEDAHVPKDIIDKVFGEEYI